MTVHVNIGSNLGDCHGSIAAAIAGIRRIKGVTVTGVSAPFESDPWGFESNNRFVNVGINLESTLEPSELLPRLLTVQHEIDSSSHRTSEGNYADRVIDIDIIACGDMVINEPPNLILPHPRMHLREFVLVPMAEILSGWRHPVLKRDVNEMLSGIVKTPKII